MRHVRQGVVQLGLAQRPARPVGEAAGLVQVDAQHLAHQGVIGDLLAKARGHAGDLGVEQGHGDHAQIVEDLHVLAGGVEHLFDSLVGEQGQERREVDPVGQGVDHRAVAGTGDLDQAKPGPVGGFAHELSVDGDEGIFGDPVAEGLQLRCGRNRCHWIAIA